MIDRYKLYLRIFLTVFWILTCYGFVAEELIPPIAGGKNTVFLLCDFIFLALGIRTIRNRGDVAVCVSFVVLAIFTTIILNHESWLTLTNGFRDFLGIIFAVPIVRWFYTHKRSAEFRKTIFRTMNIWLWLQAFCITWQFIRYGAGDMGGGTMGEGASGMVSMLIYLTSFCLISRTWDTSDYMLSLRKNWKYILLLYPTFLNETKVSFLMLAAYFVLLLKYDRKLVLRLFYIVPIAIGLFIGLGAAYFSATGQDTEEVLSSEFIEEYMYGLDLDRLVEIGQMVQDGIIEVDPSEPWSQDIPRIAKLGLIIYPLELTGGGVLFGAGVGEFKGWTVVNMPTFAAEYQWLLQGSRPWLFFLLVQIGIVGILWWGWTAFHQYFIRRSKQPLNTQFQLFLWGSLAIILFYNDSLREIWFTSWLAILTLSYRYSDDEDISEDDISAPVTIAESE